MSGGAGKETEPLASVADLWLSMCPAPQSLRVRLTKGGAGRVVRYTEMHLSGYSSSHSLQAEGEPGVLDPLFLRLRQRKSGCGKHPQRYCLVPGPVDLGLLKTGLGS